MALIILLSTVRMMKVVVVLLIFVNILFVLGNKWECTDYYWRDYHGTTPSDAIPAGKDSENRTLYVGLVYIRGFELLPATIYPEKKIAVTTAYAHVLNASQNVKILCSPYPEAFEWSAIKSEDLHSYIPRNLIPGGSEVGENLYIGRVFRDNSVIIGKIFRHERSNKGIWFPFNNGPANSLTYEILSYDCYKTKIIDVDVRNKVDSSNKN